MSIPQSSNPTSLVQRLRVAHVDVISRLGHLLEADERETVYGEAADEIDRLRLALQRIRDKSLSFISKDGIEITKLAKAALEDSPVETSAPQWVEGPPTAPGWYVLHRSSGRYDAMKFDRFSNLFRFPQPDNYGVLRHFPFAEFAMKSNEKPSASTGDVSPNPSPSPVECPKCRTQLAFEGDTCGLCSEES